MNCSSHVKLEIKEECESETQPEVFEVSDDEDVDQMSFQVCESETQPEEFEVSDDEDVDQMTYPNVKLQPGEQYVWSELDQCYVKVRSELDLNALISRPEPEPEIVGTAKKKVKRSEKAVTSPLSDNERYPKPVYPYSCLIALALKNSMTGCLPVSDIYSFISKHFPYYRSAPVVWKNSVRRHLSLNKSFKKIVREIVGIGGPGSICTRRPGYLWTLNPDRIKKVDQELVSYSKKDPITVKRAMKHPNCLKRLERGEMKMGEEYWADMEFEDNDDDLDCNIEPPDSSGSSEAEDYEEEPIAEIPPLLALCDPLVDPLKLDSDREELDEVISQNKRPRVSSVSPPTSITTNIKTETESSEITLEYNPFD